MSAGTVSSLPKPSSELHASDRCARENDLRQGLAALRLEGLSISGEALKIFESYAQGHMTIEQMGDAIDSLHEQRYGRSLPLSGNTNPRES
jgi:hypothetical protein